MTAPELVDAARLWPGAPDDAPIEDVVALLGGLSELGREVVVEWLPQDPHRAAALAWALHCAAQGGWAPVERLSEALVLAGPDGVRCLLAVLAFRTPVHEAGEPEVVEKLREALDGAMGDRRYLLHVRERLPDDLDPVPVSRAVHLWLMAIERGDWYGRHAVYEDEGISLEISLTGERCLDGQRPSMMWVQPLFAMERAADAAHAVASLIFDLEEEDHDDLPLVTVLAAHTLWRLPRGHLTQVLYGQPDRVTAEDEARVMFAHTSQGLFSDPTARRLNALWWVESGAEPTSLVGWSCENPWCDGPAPAPVFPGTRFAVHSRPDALGVGPAELAWEGEPITWRP